jgi:hypothetical protein
MLYIYTLYSLNTAISFFETVGSVIDYPETCFASSVTGRV